MRYLTALVKPTEGKAFHPLGKELTDDPSIKRKAIHHIELLDDDTVLLFAEASGSKERYEQIMEESPHVIGYLTAGEDRWMAVSQFEPTEEVRKSLELQRESLLVIETPIHFTSENNLKATYIGTDETFRKMYEYAEEMDHPTFEILKVGDYEASESSIARVITDRQEEVLEVAVDLGYYCEPRQASLEDIGEVIGISPGTVGEHLRKAEKRVFTELVD
ncbi:helix-turn-helix domain-containing protein [Halalkalicoccus jeotgali]|uniref:Bacterio-opsin activator HTH domain protein n=1 Tax=Halalkalicoccus jeotgali (strain DSM 18796 / CECT 7217 / JCM 14584 / KCTC 4019 / B3) TaxID=795797 RepID=D8JCB8_HALJB|nr:helix-turn-helix domain-containing protein [Halalkalicoccus jeotgali]ADJ17025.1 Bacterio-opsin activator HTH domain protein [Halalkalicoccus jeotgali B3]ELY38812.1 Bacterio-opsin activator HTH domain protein [Halalkalicoccus jeotgali B3]